MAFYDYLCPIHDIFEIEHSIKIILEECPKCEEEKLPPQKIVRLISKCNFALSGGCWAKDNYSK